MPGQPGAFVGEAALSPPLSPIGPEELVIVRAQASAARAFGAKTFSAKAWLIGIALIAGGGGGYMSGYAPRAAAPERLPAMAEADRMVAATTQVAPHEAAPAATPAPPAPQLTVDAVRQRRANEPAALAISYTGAGADAAVVIEGLAPGSALLTGIPEVPNAWRLVSADLKHAVIEPPQDFVGRMDLSLELRLADDTVVDRRSLQLEWSAESAVAPVAPATPPPRQLDASEITLLMNRGSDFVANGNFGAARMMFQPAAEAGDATAAFALAETYDPSVLEKRGAKGITPDVALARQWYGRAFALGSTAALERLVGLTH